MFVISSCFVFSSSLLFFCFFFFSCRATAPPGATFYFRDAPVTVAGKFKKQMVELHDNLSSSQCCFIRCVKVPQPCDTCDAAA